MLSSCANPRSIFCWLAPVFGSAGILSFSVYFKREREKGREKERGVVRRGVIAPFLLFIPSVFCTGLSKFRLGEVGDVGVEMPGSWTCKTKAAFTLELKGERERGEDVAFLYSKLRTHPFPRHVKGHDLACFFHHSAGVVVFPFPTHSDFQKKKKISICFQQHNDGTNGHAILGWGGRSRRCADNACTSSPASVGWVVGRGGVGGGRAGEELRRPEPLHGPRGLAAGHFAAAWNTAEAGQVGSGWVGGWEGLSSRLGSTFGFSFRFSAQDASKKQTMYNHAYWSSSLSWHSCSGCRLPRTSKHSRENDRPGEGGGGWRSLIEHLRWAQNRSRLRRPTNRHSILSRQRPAPEMMGELDECLFLWVCCGKPVETHPERGR